MDRDRLLITLEVYVAGPRLCRILETFWDFQQVVLRQNSFHGTSFPITRGKMQGGTVSPTMFNMVVDNVIKTWLFMIVEEQRVDHNGI